MKFVQQITTKLFMCFTVLMLLNVQAHAANAYDQSTPEGAVRLMFKALTEDNFMEFMSVADFESAGEEVKALSQEELQQVLKMLEPKMRPIMQQLSEEIKKVGGVKNVDILSRKDLADGTVSLQVKLLLGNGETSGPEEMIMVKRGNVYKFSPKD